MHDKCDWIAGVRVSLSPCSQTAYTVPSLSVMIGGCSQIRGQRVNASGQVQRHAAGWRSRMSEGKANQTQLVGI